MFGDRPVPANLLYRMTACLNYYDATISFLANADQAAAWARHNPVHLRMMQTIREMRIKQ